MENPAKPRGVGGIHRAASNGDVPALQHFLRVTPWKVHDEDPFGGGLKEWLNCDSGGVVGGRCQKKSSILKFGVNRNLDFSMLVYVWI